MYKFRIKLRIAKQFGKTLYLQKIHLPSNKQERLPGPEPGNTFHYLNQSLASCLATHYLTESLFTTVQLDRSESEAGATRSDTFCNFLILVLFNVENPPALFWSTSWTENSKKISGRRFCNSHIWFSGSLFQNIKNVFFWIAHWVKTAFHTKFWIYHEHDVGVEMADSLHQGFSANWESSIY